LFNERIFNHKANSILSLLDFVLFLVNFGGGHLGLPIKKKVVVSILIYARKRMRRDGDSSAAIVPVGTPLRNSDMAGPPVVVASLESVDVGNGGCA